MFPQVGELLLMSPVSKWVNGVSGGPNGCSMRALGSLGFVILHRWPAYDATQIARIKHVLLKYA